MRKDLEQRLVERWPTWFNTGGDIKHTLMPWGLTHDDGCSTSCGGSARTWNRWLPN
jgi:hypothetical protein